MADLPATDEASTPRRTGLAGAAERVITVWAVLGGVVILAVVAVNVWSVLSGLLAGWPSTATLIAQPFSGDQELTELGVAIAAFAFLPYCQLTGANVTADIFTARASRRWVAVFVMGAALVALAFAVLLTWRTWAGLESQREYSYQTTVLQLQVWWAYVPAVASLALLAVAALITFVESLSELGARSG